MNRAALSAADLAAFGLDPSWSRLLDVPGHDGLTHRWHVLDRPGTDPEAPTIVCLHGNPTWSFLWSRVLGELDPAFRVIAPDHLSMGFSERVGARPFADRVADAYDLLTAMHVAGRVWLVAQDWGGAIAMGLAVAHPELVAGMVLSNTGIAVPAGRRAPWLIRLAAGHGVHRLVTRSTPLFVRGTPFLPGRPLTRVQRRALAAPYRSAADREAVAGFVADVPFTEAHPSSRALDAVASALGSLDMPVRLVWGARDPVFDDDFADDLRGRFRDVELHRIADAGHLCVLETSIAGFIEAAIAAASEHTPAASPVAGPDGDSLWSRIVAARDSGEQAISDATADETITNAEFATRVATYAAAMSAEGVRPGDRVAVLVPPGIDLIAVVYSCWRIGAVTVVADRGLGLRGLGRAVRSARVRFVVGPRRAIVAARALRWAPRATSLAVRALRRAAPAAIDALALATPAPDDPAAVVFTSGATGPAKGVRYTHRQLCAQRDALRALYGITAGDRFVAAFAPFAVFGPALGIVTGLADMDVTAPATLTATALDDACRRIGATMVFASPAALANVLRTATGPLPALAQVRLVMSAGAPVPIETLRGLARLCPQAELCTPYGMTEVLPVADISLTRRVAVGAGRGVCVGTPVPGCDVLIADWQPTCSPLATGSSTPLSLTPLAVGTTGEVVVHTPWMSSGYDRLWHTQRSARPVHDGRTWHRTGDVGHVDTAGNLWIEGRVVHLVHTPSGAIAPVPLEVAAEAVPGVARAAAVGIGPRGVQQVVLVVELSPPATDRRDGPATPELAAAVRAAVAPQPIAAVWTARQLPVDIRHNAKIDRTALGRTMERVLSGERTMKVLVTGAGSLLLGGVAAALAARGDDVVCLQRRPLNLPSGMRQVQGDVRDAAAVRAAAEGCDAILHGAARVGVLGTWEDFRSVNVDGTANVLAAAGANGIARVVHVSTPSVAHAGRSLVGVGAEPAVTGRRGAFYVESKALAEQVALAGDSADLAVVAVRPHLVWGPGDAQLVGRIVERATADRLVMVGDGAALVDTTYLDNAVSAHVAALDAVRPGAVCAGRAYVVANGEPRTVRELVQGICRAAGVPFEPRRVSAALARRVGTVVEKVWPRFREGEPPITRFVAEQLGTAHWFDPRPARDDLGWSPEVSLDAGFELLRRWFAAQHPVS